MSDAKHLSTIASHRGRWERQGLIAARMTKMGMRVAWGQERGRESWWPPAPVNPE